jgi:hypothetical protein
MTEKNSPKNNKNIFNLLLGFLFIGVGGYRLYSHYFTETVYSNFRLVLSILLIGFGINSFYKYFK